MSGNTVNLRDFAGGDSLSVFKNAMKYCRENPHTTLVVPPGKYILRDEAAVRLMDDVMNGKMGNNPQERIFTHYFPYSKGIDFNGCEDVTLEGNGAWIICDGWMEPITVEKCRNVTIRGITIDSLRKPYSVGTVVGEEKDWYDILFDEKYPVNENMPSPRLYMYLEEQARFFSEGWDCEEKKKVGQQVIRFYGERPKGIFGKTVCVWHGFHFRPAIFIHEAVNTNLYEVTIHSQPGMGIVGHRSENIHAQKLRIVPEAGEIMSTNTDATHFTSCKGEICFKDCQFEGHGDDAVNVHNYYYTIKSNKGKTCEIAVENADTHAQVLDYPDVSDTLELVAADTLVPIRKYKVISVENFEAQWKSKVVLDDSLPENCGDLYLVDVTRLPALRFTGCYVKNHLARAVLIKTRDVLVEGCTFEDSLGTAIHIAAEGGWREGIPASHVVIRNNRMLRCGRGNHDNAMGASAICVNIDAPDPCTPNLHKDLLIENNIILGDNSPQGIYISSAQDVVIRNNEIADCVEPIKVLRSTHVVLSGNHVVKAAVSGRSEKTDRDGRRSEK